MVKKNQFTFNGQNLSELIEVQKFNKGISLGRNSRYNTRNGRKGADYLGFTSEVVTFSMDFLFKPDVVNKKEKLAKILNVDEPKELTNSSEPGIVYLAFPVSNIESDESSIFGDGTIVWEIPAGVAQSIATHMFTNTDSDGALQDFITVNNPGTEDMEVELEAIFSSDNGFIGVETDTGKALIGDMTEVDKTPYKRSEKLFDDAMYVSRGWAINTGVIPPVTSTMAQQGTVSYVTETSKEGYVKPNSYGTAGAGWTGPSLTKTIPVDSEGGYPIDWTSGIRLDFNPDGSGKLKPTEIGHQSVSFIDQNNKIIVSIVIEDNHANAERSDFAVYIRNKRVYDSRNTTSYYYTARPGDGNHFYIEKLNNKIMIRLVRNNSYKNESHLTFPFTEPGIQLRKVTWYAARYKSFRQMHNNLLRALNVVKLNVQKWNDIPNKFMSGDVLKYGKTGRTIYCTVNNINELRLRDVGSKVLTVPPGNSIVYLAYSEFATTPKVTLRGKARYVI